MLTLAGGFMMNDALAFASGVVHFLTFIYLFSKVGAALEEHYGYPFFGPVTQSLEVMV